MSSGVDDRVFADLPPEDVGAATQARFRFQADCTAKDCIRILSDGGPIAVVCEWHEDYIVVHSSKPSEFVSVKHRELSQGPWTFAQLIGRGGLGHLYGRWQEFGGLPIPRLCTNAGLKPGPTEAGGLGHALMNRDRVATRTFANAMADTLAADPLAVMRFLSVLRLEAELPQRAHIGRVHAVLLRPAMREHGLDPALDQDCYQRLVERALRASRDDPPPPAATLAFLERPDAYLASAVRDLRLAGRTIDRGTVMGVLRDTQSATARPSEAVSTRLRAKLEAGGFGPTAVHRAQKLRAAWYSYASAQPDSDASRIERIRDSVHLHAELSESETRTAGPYGLPMSRDLRERLGLAAAALRDHPDIDASLLMGCAFELTDECSVWWSPEAMVAP